MFIVIETADIYVFAFFPTGFFDCLAHLFLVHFESRDCIYNNHSNVPKTKIKLMHLKKITRNERKAKIYIVHSPIPNSSYSFFFFIIYFSFMLLSS